MSSKLKDFRDKKSTLQGHGGDGSLLGTAAKSQPPPLELHVSCSSSQSHWDISMSAPRKNSSQNMVAPPHTSTPATQLPPFLKLCG